MIKKTLACFLWFTAIYLAPRDVAAQQLDSLLATRQKTDCQYVLTRDKSAPGYSKQRMQACIARMDSIVAMHLSPVTPPPPPPNQAPVARIATSCDNTTKSCAVNGSASTDDKAIASATIQWGDGASTAALTASHQYTTTVTRTYTVSLTVRDAEGLTGVASAPVTISVAAPDTVIVQQPPPDSTVSIAVAPAAPTPVTVFTFPAPTRTRTIAPPADLQAALNATVAGDEIILAGTFTGVFTYPVVCDPNKWVTIRSATFPAEGVRARPSTSTAYGKLISPDYRPALLINGPSCNLRLLGFEVGHSGPTTAPNYNLVVIGDGGWAAGGDTQTSLARVPRNIVLDRMYIHGAPTSELVRCIALNSANTAILNSWIDECHASGSDAQAIAGWNGPGPYLIENNTLVGSGENVIFGGADPGIAGLVPSDITIRRNWFYKPLAWRTLAKPWCVKNLFELKNSQRVLVESNVFENTWPHCQEGMAIVLKSATASCGTCTWEGTTDVAFRFNVVRNAAVGLNLQAIDLSPGQISTTRHLARVSVTDNLFDNIGAEGRAAAMMFTHDLADITIHRNTFKHAPNVGSARGSGLTMDYSNGAARRYDFRNNIIPMGAYWFFYTGGAIGSDALRAAISDGSFRVTGNAFVNVGTEGYLSAKFPAGNTFPTTYPTSGVGVDITELLRRTSGVVVP